MHSPPTNYLDVPVGVGPLQTAFCKTTLGHISQRMVAANTSMLRVSLKYLKRRRRLKCCKVNKERTAAYLHQSSLSSTDQGCPSAHASAIASEFKLFRPVNKLRLVQPKRTHWWDCFSVTYVHGCHSCMLMQANINTHTHKWDSFKNMLVKLLLSDAVCLSYAAFVLHHTAHAWS